MLSCIFNSSLISYASFFNKIWKEMNMIVQGRNYPGTQLSRGAFDRGAIVLEPFILPAV